MDHLLALNGKRKARDDSDDDEEEIVKSKKPVKKGKKVQPKVRIEYEEEKPAQSREKASAYTNEDIDF